MSGRQKINELSLICVKRRTFGDVVFLLNREEEARLEEKVTTSSHLKIEFKKMITVSDAVEFRRVRREMKVLKDRALITKTLVLSQSARSLRIAELICKLHLKGVRMIDFESALLELEPSVSSRVTELIPVFSKKALRQDFLLRAYDRSKWIIEPIIAFLILIFLAPLLLLVGLLVRCTSSGPIFYSQARVGYRGKVFKIRKFRTMRTDAEKNGPQWATARNDDARLTPVGNFLRKSHLDELPQLWNVMKGELGFIGPRPERPIFIPHLLAEIPLFRLRVLLKPGITGWAQVNMGYANSIADSRRKLEFDLFYLLRRSPLLDLRIVLATLRVLFSGGTENRRLKLAAKDRLVEQEINWALTEDIRA